MFLVVSRFSSPVSFIELGGFLPGSHFFFQQLPRSAELASKERGNCNNITLGPESSQSGNYVTTIIQNFTLVNLTSTTLYQVCLPFGASGLFLDLCTRLLLTLYTRALTVYATELAGYLCRMICPSIIYKSPTCQGMRLDYPRISLGGKEQPVG